LDQRTLLVKCGDSRLVGREGQLTDYFHLLDGMDPFRLLIPGAAKCLAHPDVVAETVVPYVELGATHVHVEDHVGKSQAVGGCGACRLAYNKLHGLPRSQPMPWETEYDQHEEELQAVPSRLKAVLRRDPTLGPVTWSFSLYAHDAVGNGKARMLIDTRGLTGFPFASRPRQPVLAATP